MLTGLIANVAAWIIGVISAAGYAGVAGLMAIEPRRVCRRPVSLSHAAMARVSSSA